MKQLKELNLFLNDSKNWTLLKKYDSKNSTFFVTWLKEFNFFMTQRIELFFWKYYLQELNFFLSTTHITDLFVNTTHIIEPFLNMTQPFFWIWLKELNLSGMRLKELSFFFRMWLTELSLFYVTHRIEPFLWLKELNLFSKIRLRDWTLLFNTTQRIEHYFFFKKKKPQRIEPFFLNMTQRTDFFQKRCFFSAS